MHSSNPDGVQSNVPDYSAAYRMKEPFHSLENADTEADVRPALFLMRSSVPAGSIAVEALPMKLITLHSVINQRLIKRDSTMD
jgi:hypothetical protein